MAAANGRGKAAAKTESAPTAYIVLQRVDLGEGLSVDALEALGMKLRADVTVWAPVLNQTAEQGPDGQPRVFMASNKTQAIRMHTGEGADVIEGVWKAVPMSSWKGGEQTKRVTAAERLPLEEASA